MEHNPRRLIDSGDGGVAVPADSLSMAPISNLFSKFLACSSFRGSGRLMTPMVRCNVPTGLIVLPSRKLTMPVSLLLIVARLVLNSCKPLSSVGREA